MPEFNYLLYLMNKKNNKGDFKNKLPRDNTFESLEKSKNFSDIVNENIDPKKDWKDFKKYYVNKAREKMVKESKAKTPGPSMMLLNIRRSVMGLKGALSNFAYNVNTNSNIDKADEETDNIYENLSNIGALR